MLALGHFADVGLQGDTELHLLFVNFGKILHPPVNSVD
jgi:hypothetical protein